VTEFIIMQRDPAVASGIPFTVIAGGKMVMIVPISGGPAAPGVIITDAPMVTGDPGIFFSSGRE
jgi:hypothetical protein